MHDSDINQGEIATNPSMEVKDPRDPMGIPLAKLRLGHRGRISFISKTTPPAERRRLYDLGLVPGTLIKAELKSPSGDPTAYKVRDTLIALRREQSERIYVKEEIS